MRKGITLGRDRRKGIKVRVLDRCSEKGLTKNDSTFPRDLLVPCDTRPGIHLSLDHSSKTTYRTALEVVLRNRHSSKPVLRAGID